MTKLVFYFLLRNKVKYEIIILIFLGIHNSLRISASQYGINYSGILLAILYILYFNILVRHQGRVPLLYKGTETNRLKYDTIKAISILSSGLFIVMSLLDIFLLKAVYLTLYHIATLGAFILSALLISINIEKPNNNNNQIVTFKEGCKIVGLGIGFNIIVGITLQFII